MHDRIDIHASFGESCPDKHTAESYIRDVVRQVDGVVFEKTIQNRDKPLGFLVQFSISFDDSVAVQQEKVVDKIHEAAAHDRGYENLVIVDGGLYNVESAD